MLKVNKELIISLLSVALYFLVFQLIGAVVARYSRDLGIDIAGTSIIWSLLMLTSLIFRPIAGYIADKTSSYLAMAIGGVFILLASINYIYSRNFAELSLARIIQGVSSAFFISPSIAAVATAAGEYAGIALGIRSMLISIGAVVAPPISGFIVDSMGYVYVFLLAISLTMIMILLNIPMIRYRAKYYKDTNIMDAGWRAAINKIVILITIVAMFGSMVFMTIYGLLQAHYRDLGYEAKVYGYFLMFFGLSSITSRLIAGNLSMKKNPLIIALTGHTIVAISMILLKTMYTIPESYIVAVIYGFGIGLTIPTQQLVTLTSVPEYARNRAIAIYAMGFDLGGFIGPLIYGYIASLYGYEASYQYMVLSPIAAILVLTLMAVKALYKST